MGQELSGTGACGRTSEGGGRYVINGRVFHSAARFAVAVGEDRGRLPAFCWLPGLHGGPCGARFVADSGWCAAAGLSGLLTSCLTTIGDRVVGCCGKVCGGSGRGLFWSVGGSCGVLNQLKSRGFRASGLSACDFSTLYTTLPRGLIGDGLVDLIGRAFREEGSLCVACGDRNALHI